MTGHPNQIASAEAPSQQRQVADVLPGGQFPDHIRSPQLAGPAYEARISAPLLDVVARESAGTAAADHSALSKHLGMDPKVVTESVSKLLAARGITADVSKLSAGTLAALHAVAQSAERAAQYRSRS